MDKTGLYIHIPFCIKKCNYCDFVSYDGCAGLKHDYVKALECEMKHYSGEEVDTVYIGGGTPTTLDSNMLCRLVESVFKYFKTADDIEFTVECNPKTADRAYFSNLKRAGVNRLSIGVQSLLDDELEFLGRVHTAKEAIEAITDAKAAGIDNINADVMFALPNQDIKSIENTLSGICALRPTHISCYSLMIEEGTPFYENGITPVDDDEERRMYYYITDYLADKGYFRYEISNYAKDGMESKHNLKYWKRMPYIGIGAAAHSFYKGKRFEKTSDLREYIQNPTEKINEITLTKADEMSEFMFLGLRMAKGVSLSDFEKNFGCRAENIFDIEKHISYGMLQRKDDHIFLTNRGIDVSNVVLSDFLIDDE